MTKAIVRGMIFTLSLIAALLALLLPWDVYAIILGVIIKMIIFSAIISLGLMAFR